MNAWKVHTGLVIGAVAVHLVLDLALIACSQAVRGPEQLWLLAIPVSQASLLAIWSAASPLRSYVRVPLAVIGVCWTWLITARLLLDHRSYDEQTAAWAAMLAIQSLLILLTLGAWQVAQQYVGRRRLSCTRTAPWQYTLGSLLIWTTVLAVFLGAGKIALQRLGWTIRVLDDRFFFMTCLLGVYNAVYAVAVLAALFAGRKIILRTVVATAVVGLFAASERFALTTIFGDDGGVPVVEWLYFAGCQAGYIYLTLLPLRIFPGVSRQPLSQS